LVFKSRKKISTLFALHYEPELQDKYGLIYNISKLQMNKGRKKNYIVKYTKKVKELLSSKKWSSRTISAVVVSARGCAPIHSIPSSHTSIANHIKNNSNCIAFGIAHISSGNLYTLGNESWDARAIPKSPYNFESPNFELELGPNHSEIASG
jgi:hypothetical protein